MTPSEALDLAIDALEAVLRGETPEPAALRLRLAVLKAAKPPSTNSSCKTGFAAP